MLQRVMSLFLIFCRKIFVSQCRKYSQVNPSVLCFRKFPVAERLMRKGGGEYQDFPSKILCLTVPKMKISVGESFIVALILGIEKICIREGEYQDLLSKILRLTVPKNSVGESFTVPLTSGSEKVWIEWGGGRVSSFTVENIMCHSAENFRRGVFYCCISFEYRKSLEKRCSNIKIFRRKLFVSRCRKIP